MSKALARSDSGNLPHNKKVRLNDEDEKTQRDLEYWVESLKGTPSIQLPTDFPRPYPHQVVEAEESCRLNNEICKGILRLSLEHDLPPFTLVLAAFIIILHKYTREEDIVFGSSSASSNPLILRIPITGADTFLGISLRLKKIEEECSIHEVPYEQLFQILKNTRDENSGPLFHVRFFNVVDVQSHTLDAASCDWTVFVEQLSDAKSILPLKLRVVYNSVLYGRERIQEMLRQIEKILGATSKNADTKVSDLSLITDYAKKVIPDPCFPLDENFYGSIQSYLSRNASRHPNKAAIVDNRNTYSYKQVDEMSNRVANFLIKGGVIKGDVVAIFSHRSAAIVLAIMGILKAGATFTVIDPAYPPERQIIYLSVAKPQGFITLQRAGKLHDDVSNYIKENLTIKANLSDLTPDTLGELEKYSIENPNIEINKDDIGTLSFTSGSTGIPKGVRGRHISYTHFYPWMKQEFSMNEDDRFSMLSGIAHDPIQRDIFTPFFLGASIYIPDAEDISTPGKLAEWMSQQGVSITHLTPAMGQLLTANATSQMPNLKVALFVGDILTKRDVTRLQNLAPNVTVVNMYGTTETQRAVSYLPIKNDGFMSQRKDIIPAGKGMKDVQLLLLTPDMKQTGIGEMGEIYSRSPHMAAGYLGLEEATKLKFLQNPFNPNNKEDRLYRTGDLGRYMPDGIVECVGRADDQVKIRGFRIELGEIDTYMSQHPDVRENVTVVRRDINEEHTLVSYFVPLRDPFDINSIREHLKTKLPTYAIPKLFVPLTSMPLTPNGKIDKNKLPFPDTALLQQKPNATGARDSTEAKLLEIWCSILGLKTIDIFDNFFDIGGHSILATKLIFQLRQELKIDLPLNMLFDNPTIALMGNAIKKFEGVNFKIEGVEVEKKVEDLNLANEAILPEDVHSHGKQFSFTQPKKTFLTGATGFLGAFILEGLLNSSEDSVVYCLVRSSNLEKAYERIKSNLEDHLIWNNSFSKRIIPILGNMEQSNLGISESDWKTLQDQVDSIIHNGALVHWVYPYHKLRAINVQSTIDLLRLACKGKRLIPFHFVSSTSVFDSEHYVSRSDLKVYEDDDMEGGKTLTVGYGQSKWVSEKIILSARTKGLPVTIIRPGYVLGHSRSGVTNTDDFLWRLIKGCVQLGSVPVMGNKVNMCSVDFVADSIVMIASKADCLGKAFHMYNPTVFRFNDFFALLSDFGYNVRPMDYIQWRQELMNLTLSTADNALYPLLHFVLDDLPTKSKAPDLDTTNTEKAIEDSTIRCSPMQEVMPIYFSYLIESGFLQPPQLQNPKRVLPKLNIKAKILTRNKGSN